MRRQRRKQLVARALVGIVGVAAALCALLLPRWWSDMHRWGERSADIRGAIEALEDVGCDENLVVLLANELDDADDATTAVSYVESYGVRCGTNERLLRIEAQLYGHVGAWRDRVTVLRRLLARYPGDVHLHEALAEALDDAGENLLAAAAYTKRLEIFGGRSDDAERCALRLIALYVEIGRVDLATHIRLWLSDEKKREGCWMGSLAPLPDPYAVWPTDRERAVTGPL